MERLRKSCLNHEIFLLWADCEEYGMGGSDSFVKSKYYKRIGVVFNLEALGYGGFFLFFLFCKFFYFF